MTTLLRDVIDIPETVHQGDFVLSLAEGVARTGPMLHDYVVTPELEQQFLKSVGIVSQAVTSRSSMASYLDGSFGSGKSHFMAVLYALLDHDTQANEMPGLASVVARRDEKLAGRKFLQVPYHLLGAESLRAGILGGYLERVRALHPDAPLPAVLAEEPLLRTARDLRAGTGDEKFFAMLNGGTAGTAGTDATAGTGGSRWGRLGEWNADRFDAALAAGPESIDRRALIAALLTALPGLAEVGAGAGTYVDLDRGLEAISRHAQGLGYDAVVLYLDELILLFMTRMADLAWVTREAPLLGKLVEAAHPDRPVPIVSFVARQRDLRTLVGSDVAGADYDRFADALSWQEGRFGTVELSDRNLPVIASRRVLAPVDGAAAARLDTAFAATDRMPADLRDTLLSEKDRAAFRLTYPFSPAVMDVLVDLSEVLQRERTALRVMRQILVDRRDTLPVDRLVPLADVFDVLVAQHEPLSGVLAARWRTAQQVYSELRRLSLEHLQLKEEDVAEGGHPAFEQEDMIAKTLVIAGLLRRVPATQNLTARKVVALNHGWIRSGVPGGEASAVLMTVRRWAARSGKVSITGDDANPVIGIRLDAVDVDAILRAAAQADSQPARRAKLRELLFGALGVTAEPGMDRAVLHQVRWRGTRRPVEIVYGNVRDSGDLTEGLFRPTGDAWRFVLDFPFDEPGFTPGDDIRRLESLRAAHPSRTVAWVPRHLSAGVVADLGRLVCATHALGQSSAAVMAHLPENDRIVARQQLTSIKDQLTSQVENALLQAYGVAVATTAVVDTQHQGADMFVSLDPSFTPRVPSGASLRSAFENLVDQTLTHDYPAHPVFDGDVEGPDLRRVLATVRSALAAADHRVDVPAAERPVLRRIANPLRLGTMAEQYFTLGDHWPTHLEREMARSSRQGTVTVTEVRAWLDRPRPMGLPPEVADLLVVAFAEQTNRAVLRHRATVDYDPRRPLPGDAELVPQPLPDPEAWKAAQRRAAAILGVGGGSDLRSARTVHEFAEAVRQRTASLRQPAQSLVEALERHGPTVLRDGASDDLPRLRTARAGRDLVASLEGAADDVALVSTLADVQLPTTDEAVGRSIGTAATVVDALSGDWAVLDTVAGWDRGADGKALEAHRVLDSLAEAWRTDEMTQSLSSAFPRARQEVTAIAIGREPKPGVVADLPDTGEREVGADAARTLGGEIADLARRTGRQVRVTWQVVQ